MCNHVSAWWVHAHVMCVGVCVCVRLCVEHARVVCNILFRSEIKSCIWVQYEVPYRNPELQSVRVASLTSSRAACNTNFRS